eukprot:3621291-Rhodomonas_salina.1
MGHASTKLPCASRLKTPASDHASQKKEKKEEEHVTSDFRASGYLPDVSDNVGRLVDRGEDGVDQIHQILGAHFARKRREPLDVHLESG